MKFNRRSSLAALAGAALGAAWFPQAYAQAKDYTGPIRILVGFNPGGATDVVARQIGDKLKDLLSQVVIVENKPGAGGMIATQQLKAAPADGSTVMLTIDHTHLIVPLTFKAPGYDPAADFTALAGVANYYNALVVANSLNVKNMAEYGAWLKAHPGQANYGVGAAGSVAQFSGQLLGQSLGVKMVAVPYKGGAPLVQDLLGGQIPAGIVSLTDAIEHHRAGKLRIVAVSGAARAKATPEVPTFTELGLKGLDKNPWLAFFGPRGMPPEFVDRFTKAVAAVLRQPDMNEKLAKIGNEVLYATPEQLQRDWVVSTTRHWAPVVKESGWELQ
ncbi:Bug family tripartite tricarboxylate transporter substrate binding protein [Variovorax terrae]|uniref:Bug family tripartite tricarboxylate transporter substrate binding protein n=1 Tax=Variovorax terrae TaxID=2923278 RepID=A0A9X1VVU5_9BURK|nr:Bug family tripartite tricarboxylate transporter substrate binding protein [Variovorax terrae]MCJ0762959.1 Bug family tripartite tricarboxylate transporter substrate binding protein [Variovorax terrae]